FTDRLIFPLPANGEMAGHRLCVANLDLRSGHEPLVVEPVQELSVVLGEPHDRRLRRSLERRERGQLVVLGLLDRGVDRPAVRAALRVPELLLHPRSEERRVGKESTCRWWEGR